MTFYDDGVRDSCNIKIATSSIQENAMMYDLRLHFSVPGFMTNVPESHVFLTSTLVGGKTSVSNLGQFFPGSNWIRRWKDPKASLEVVEATGAAIPTPRSSGPGSCYGVHFGDNTELI
jgi:hypothetical protein